MTRQRKYLFAATMIAALVLGLASAQARSPFESRGAEWIAHFNNGDIEALGQLYTADARFEDASGASVQGREAIEKYLAAFREAGVTEVEAETQRVEVSPDWALDYSVYGFFAEDGTNVASGNSVILLRFEEGEWKVFFHFARRTPQEMLEAEAAN